MRTTITMAILIVSMVSHVTPAYAQDLCEKIRAQRGDEVTTRCSLNAFTLKTSSGTMVGVDCDDPMGSGREITAGASPAKLLTSLETIKLQAMFQGDVQNSPVAILKIEDDATLGSVQPLAARRLCNSGEKSLACDDLSGKHQALDVLKSSTQSVPQTSFDEIKRGTLDGKPLSAIFITFGLRLSELTACRYE